MAAVPSSSPTSGPSCCPSPSRHRPVALSTGARDLNLRARVGVARVSNRAVYSRPSASRAVSRPAGRTVRVLCRWVGFWVEQEQASLVKEFVGTFARFSAADSSLSKCCDIAPAACVRTPTDACIRITAGFQPLAERQRASPRTAGRGRTESWRLRSPSSGTGNGLARPGAREGAAH